jgi:hypothetical protein
MTCARWQELEDEQILALRTELRSNRLNGSGMNKIVRYSVQHQGEQVTRPNLQSLRRPCLLCLAAHNRCLLRRQYLNQGAYAVYHR